MRPLKPYVLALGGFIAAVLGAVFLGVPPPTPAAPTSGPHPDLQSKRMASSAELAPSREAKPAGKTSAPDTHFPARGTSESNSLRAHREFASHSWPAAPERIIDWRQLLLVGVIELRI